MATILQGSVEADRSVDQPASTEERKRIRLDLNLFHQHIRIVLLKMGGLPLDLVFRILVKSFGTEMASKLILAALFRNFDHMNTLGVLPRANLMNGILPVNKTEDSS